MSRGQPLPSAREDGVSRGHNNRATGINTCYDAGAGDTSTMCMDDGAGLINQQKEDAHNKPR